MRFFLQVLLFQIFIVATLELTAQSQRPLMVAVLANATTLPTNPGEIFSSIHPGLAIGTAFRYNRSPGNQLSQTLKLSYNYHQFVHHSVQLYSEFEFKKFVFPRVNLASALGVGYTHLFTATQVFRRNENGQYVEKSKWGRPQVMGTFALGAGYILNPDRPIEIFTRYQFWVQAPFVNKYVPVLPNTTLHLGLNYPLFKTKD